MIPVKGERPYFDEALESLMSQGMGDDLEIIVQDGDDLTQRHEGSEAQRGEKNSESLSLCVEKNIEGVRWYKEEDKCPVL